AAPPRAIRGRQFRPAAQAGAEARGLGRGGAGVVVDIGPQRRRCRAHRPAVDAGAAHGGEEQPVEPRVPAEAGTFTDVRIGQGGDGRHARRLAPVPIPDWPFPDINATPGSAGRGRPQGLASTGASVAGSPSPCRSGRPSMRTSSGYTSTLSITGRRVPLRNAGPWARNTARMDGRSGS